LILKAWLERHPYLKATAELHALIERAVADVDLSAVPVPQWDAYLEDYRAERTVLADAIGYNPWFASINAGTGAERVMVEMVTHNYFAMLGVDAAAGRLFHPDEGRVVGDAPVLVLSYAYWQSRFVGDPAVVGRVVRVNGRPFTIIGVASSSFKGTQSLLRESAWIPASMIDVLADPGTFCYHGQPEWRRYFRSTLGHNTLELDGTDQSVSGGPFLWTRHARTRVLTVDSGDDVTRWSAEHDGYEGSVHRRRVELTPSSGELRVVDEVRGPRRAVRLAFHLGPAITAELAGNRARLTWARDGEDRSAVLDLPGELTWEAHRGESEPPLGWYSAGFGRKEPATALVGAGFTDGAEGFTTVLRFQG